MKFWKYLRWAGSLVAVVMIAWAVAHDPEARSGQSEPVLRPVPDFRQIPLDERLLGDRR